MPELITSAHLHVGAVEESAQWYDPNAVPKAFRDLHPSILRRAFREADGNWRRVVRDDGADHLIVLNHSVW